MRGIPIREALPAILRDDAVAARVAFEEEQLRYTVMIAGAIRSIMPPIDWDSVRAVAEEVDVPKKLFRKPINKEEEITRFIHHMDGTNATGSEYMYFLGFKGTLADKVVEIFAPHTVYANEWLRAQVRQTDPERVMFLMPGSFLINGHQFGLNQETVEENITEINTLAEAQWLEQKIHFPPLFDRVMEPKPLVRKYRINLHRRLKDQFIPLTFRT